MNFFYVDDSVRYPVFLALCNDNSVDPICLCRLEAAVIDLIADDNVGMKKQKSVFHWDKVL